MAETKNQIELTEAEQELIRLKREEEKIKEEKEKIEKLKRLQQETSNADAYVASEIKKYEKQREAARNYFDDFDEKWDLKETEVTIEKNVTEFNPNAENSEERYPVVYTAKGCTTKFAIHFKQNPKVKVSVCEHFVSQKTYPYRSHSTGFKLFVYWPGIDYKISDRAYSRPSTIMKKVYGWVEEGLRERRAEDITNQNRANIMKLKSSFGDKVLSVEPETLWTRGRKLSDRSSVDTVKFKFKNGCSVYVAPSSSDLGKWSIYKIDWPTVSFEDRHKTPLKTLQALSEMNFPFLS